MLRIFFLLFFTCYAEITLSNSYKIGMLLDQLQTERWQRDRDFFVARAAEKGVKVYVKAANGDEKIQLAQIDNMLKRRVDVLVIVAVNGKNLRDPIARAKSAGVKILAYDRLINNADIDFYVSFDNVDVGELQATFLLKSKPRGNYFLIGGAPTDNNAKLVRQGQMKVLQPTIDSGKIKVVGDEWADGWSAQNAYKLTTAMLKKKKNISAIVASNDAIAQGAIRALADFQLDGKVAVSGQDAELSALRRVVKGLQTVTIYKPIESLANMAADVAIDLASNTPIKATSSMDNGVKSVPAILLKPIAVNKKNLDSTVIADGFQSKRKIYN